MNKVVIALALLVGAIAITGWPALGARAAEGSAHRVVLELTSDDSQAWDGVLNNIENVRKALPGTAVQLVAHGKGLSLLVSAKNAGVRERMQKQASEGVVFAACENTMKRQNVTKQQLVGFAKTVDSGLAEVIRKQEAQWSYLRVVP